MGEIAVRVAHGRAQRSGNSVGQGHAEGVAVARGVLDRDVARRPGEQEHDRAPLGDEGAGRGRHAAIDRSRAHLVGREIPHAQEEVVDAVGVARAESLVQVLELALDGVDGVGVEEFAQRGRPQQLPELRLVDGQGLGAALGQWRVALVDVVGHVAEEECGGEGRRGPGIDGHRSDGARGHVAQRAHEGRHVEHVAQALPVCLQEYREGAVLRGHREEIGGAPALLPEGRAPAGMAPRQQERAGGGLAKPGREERGGAELAEDERLDLFGIGQDQAGSGGSSVSGKRTTKPSSAHRVSTSTPVSRRTLATAAIAHGAWICPPRGDSTQRRQSPSSSRQRSMTTVRSSGTAPASA